MRKGKLEHLLTTGKIEGKRSRGRQRIKIQDGIAAWLGKSTAEMFVDARDREKWKVMIAYACNRHGNWWWCLRSRQEHISIFLCGMPLFAQNVLGSQGSNSHSADDFTPPSAGTFIHCLRQIVLLAVAKSLCSIIFTTSPLSQKLNQRLMGHWQGEMERSMHAPQPRR